MEEQHETAEQDIYKEKTWKKAKESVDSRLQRSIEG